MSLKDKLIKNSTIKETSLLSKSTIFGKQDCIPTPIPMLNVALSGDVEGGLTSGVTVLAGPSKHFKSVFSLIMAKSFLNMHEDGVILFYDSEFGTPESYFDSLSLDKESVVHSPIVDVEQLKHDIVNQLANLERKDNVLILIDSIGNLASKKEVDDTLEGKQVTDMTRAKAIKSLFRMVTPHLTIKDIPMIVVGHTYQTLELYSKAVVSGGTGMYYSASNIWVLGRQQDKDADKEVQGFHYIINVEKSRYVKEKSKIPITVSFDKGIQKWSGMLDVALELGYVGKPKKGYYQQIDPDTGEFLGDEYKEADITNNNPFWTNLFKTTNITKAIEKEFALGAASQLIDNDDVILEVDDD